MCCVHARIHDGNRDVGVAGKTRHVARKANCAALDSSTKTSEPPINAGNRDTWLKGMRPFQP